MNTKKWDRLQYYLYHEGEWDVAYMALGRGEYEFVSLLYAISHDTRVV